MSFALADMIVRSGLIRGFKNLRNNPHHLFFILSGYQDIPDASELVGDRYLDNAVDFIMENSVMIKPFEYNLTAISYPHIQIVASYSEEQRYVGDYGSHLQDTKKIPPFVIGKINILKIKKDHIVAAIDQGTLSLLRLGIYIKDSNGFVFKSQGWNVLDNGTVIIYPLLEDLAKVSKNQSFKDWTLQSSEGNRSFKVNASHEQAQIRLILQSSGGIELHKILSIITRYCIKYSRLYMEGLGLQNLSIAQNVPQLVEDHDMIFESSFSLGGTILDSWISEEYNTIKEPLDYDLIASSMDSENQSVILKGGAKVRL